MSKILSDSGLDLLFREARTHSYWRGGDISDAQLREVYDLAKMPPTSANSSPMRLVFLRSRAAKERLAPALMAGNLAYGDASKPHPRSPRLDFEDACHIL